MLVSKALCRPDGRTEPRGGAAGAGTWSKRDRSSWKASVALRGHLANTHLWSEQRRTNPSLTW